MFNNITTQALELALFALPGTVVTGQIANGPIQQITLPNSPTVDAFFIDSITFRGMDGDRCAQFAQQAGRTALTANQATTILGSALAQNTGKGNFINLEPIIFAAPEPIGAMLSVFGLLALLIWRKKQTVSL